MKLHCSHVVIHMCQGVQILLQIASRLLVKKIWKLSTWHIQLSIASLSRLAIYTLGVLGLVTFVPTQCTWFLPKLWKHAAALCSPAEVSSHVRRPLYSAGASERQSCLVFPSCRSCAVHRSVTEIYMWMNIMNEIFFFDIMKYFVTKLSYLPKVQSVTQQSDKFTDCVCCVCVCVCHCVVGRWGRVGEQKDCWKIKQHKLKS